MLCPHSWERMNRCQLDCEIPRTNIRKEEWAWWRQTFPSYWGDQKQGGSQGGKVVVDTKEYLVFNAGITAVNVMNKFFFIKHSFKWGRHSFVNINAGLKVYLDITETILSGNYNNYPRVTLSIKHKANHDRGVWSFMTRTWLKNVPDSNLTPWDRLCIVWQVKSLFRGMGRFEIESTHVVPDGLKLAPPCLALK